MKLPAKVNYALKAVLELSLSHKNASPVRISSIAKAQNIPKNFLLHILIRLKNAGIVLSARGSVGGYLLAKAPGKISLADVFRAVDDTIIGMSGRHKPLSRNQSEYCIDRMWEDISSDVEQYLKKLTFEDMVNRLSKAPLTYDI